MKQNISKARLIFNGIGCLVIVGFGLTIFFSLVHDLGSVSSPKPNDPDGDKALGVYMAGLGFSGLLGLIAFISLIRTVKRWRSLPRE